MKSLPLDFEIDIDRREFLERVGAAAACLAAGSLAGCQEDPTIFPTEGWKLWIASRIHGRVVDTETQLNVPEATVVFRAGLDRIRLFELARTRATTGGNYEILAADSSSGSNGFFRIVLPDQDRVDPDRSITVYCQIDCGKDGRTGSTPFTLPRRPEENPPQPIDLEHNAFLRPGTEPP